MNDSFESKFNEDVYQKYKQVFSLCKNDDSFTVLFLNILSKCHMKREIHIYPYPNIDATIGPVIQYGWSVYLCFKINDFEMFRYFISDKSLYVVSNHNIVDTHAFHNMCLANYKIDHIKKLFEKHLNIVISHLHFSCERYEKSILMEPLENRSELGLFK